MRAAGRVARGTEGERYLHFRMDDGGNPRDVALGMSPEREEALLRCRRRGLQARGVPLEEETCADAVEPSRGAIFCPEANQTIVF